MSGLSLSALFFLLIIILPGYARMLISGRKQDEMSIGQAILQGTIMLMIALFILAILQINNVNLFNEFFDSLKTLSGVEGNSVKLGPFFAVFMLTYSCAFITGLLELALVVRLKIPQTCGIQVKRVSWIMFGLKGNSKRFAISPGVLLRDVFVAYRLAGLRPFVGVSLKNGEKLQGEVLRYSWGGRESILLRDADEPDKLTWLSLDDVNHISFLNLTALKTGNRQYEGLFLDRDGVLLERILPGLVDETVGK